MSPLSKGDRYARLEVAGRKVVAHKVVWEHHHGPVPEGMDAHHLCHTQRCVRVEHLGLKDHALHKVQHVQEDGHYNSRKTHCVRGHPFDAQNTLLSRGRRHCRECMRDYQRRRALRS